MTTSEILTLQSFLTKYPDYYLTAIDNTIMLEVDCKKRRNFPTDSEIEEIKLLGYVNVLSSTDYTMCCCGSASFSKILPVSDSSNPYKATLL